ncbi:DUF4258 domain-containing protein [Parathermosynechococcus lividus]|uniref:DUF4258 domain-containing protein n=1 Tax=Parathermosynechococcus lividus TaxID=33070 RepID=UPI001D0D192B
MSQLRFTAHALEEMQRRGIAREQVEAVLSQPEQILLGRNRRTIYQSRIRFDGEKQYLLRVFVDETISPSVVITVYRTSKIQKYWRMS